MSTQLGGLFVFKGPRRPCTVFYVFKVIGYQEGGGGVILGLLERPVGMIVGASVLYPAIFVQLLNRGLQGLVGTVSRVDIEVEGFVRTVLARRVIVDV